MTEALLILARAVQFAAAIVLFGQFVFASTVSVERRLPARFHPVAAGCAFALVVSAVAWLALESSSMSGEPLGDAIRAETWRIVLSQTFFGHVWILRAVLFAVLCAELVALRRNENATWRAAGAATAMALLGTLACAGHAAGGIGGARAAHVAIDAVHLVAAGAWVGSLVPLVALLDDAARRPEAQGIPLAWRAAKRFSTLGIACVGALVLTGVVNTLYTVHTWTDLVDSRYGVELAAKICVFAVMLLLAAVNRVRLTPSLVPGAATAPAALATLTRNARYELGLGLVVIGIVAVLGVTMPPMGAMH